MAEDEPDRVLRAYRTPVLVRDIFEAKGYAVVDMEEDDVEPSQPWHLYWRNGRFRPSDYAAASPLQRLNHFPKTMGITKKDCLLRNLRRMRATHGAIYNFFPESFLLPTEYLTLVRACESRALEGASKPIWILKPTDSSQGRKIFLIRDVSEISYGAHGTCAPPRARTRHARATATRTRHVRAILSPHPSRRPFLGGDGRGGG